jgi:hypothetical protein
MATKASRRTKVKKKTRSAPKPKDFVVVQNKSYGNKLKGTKIYFEGRKPRALQKDGRIKFGKHILETLGVKFDRFRWIITPDTDSIETKRNITRVRTSLRLLDRMGKEEWDRKRDIKNNIVRGFFSITFPSHFSDSRTPTYAPGTLACLLHEETLSKLSREDRDALQSFIPNFVATESVGTVNLLKASAQIKTLRGLARDLEQEIGRDHGEPWWQDYIRANILLMQQGYIRALSKLNVAVGGTKLPDFALVTHDNYLDILEIKRPNTTILKEDTSRNNFYWDAEVSKAISQTENYIESVGRHQDALRSYLKDQHGIEAKALRPRGIILVGDTRRFTATKMRDDFRLLSQGIKNITILTYDELLTRLKNYISVLEEFSKALPARPRRASRKRSSERAIQDPAGDGPRIIGSHRSPRRWSAADHASVRSA